MDPRYKRQARSAAKKNSKRHGPLPPAYRAAQVESAGRLGRLLLTLNIAIEAANKKDAAKLEQSLTLLKRTMQVEPAPEFVIGLMRLYTHCQHAARAGNFAECTRILSQLKLAFATMQQS